jgi:hypothetical protein
MKSQTVLQHNPFSSKPKGEFELLKIPDQPSAARKPYLVQGDGAKAINPISDSVSTPKPKIITVTRDIYS